MALQKTILEFYSEGNKFTDFILVSSNGDQIPCHKVILALRCELFNEMFKTVDENSTNEPFAMKDANTKDLQAFVDYIYTDQVREDAATNRLLTLADKFLLDELKMKCLGTMIDTITLDNASGILDVFNDFNCRDLLTGEMSWKFQNYIKFSIENCLEIFLIAYKYDLAVLKINALYFIKDNWNKIKDSENSRKLLTLSMMAFIL